MGPGREADLDAGLAGHSSHLPQVGIGQQQHPAALRDAVHHHAPLSRLVEDGPQACGPLGAWNFDPELRTVRKPLARRRRFRQVSARQPDAR